MAGADVFGAAVKVLRAVRVAVAAIVLREARGSGRACGGCGFAKEACGRHTTDIVRRAPDGRASGLAGRAADAEGERDEADERNEADASRRGLIGRSVGERGWSGEDGGDDDCGINSDREMRNEPQFVFFAEKNEDLRKCWCVQ